MIDIDPAVLKKARDWAKNPAFDQDFRDEIQSLIDSEYRAELVDAFYTDLSFGTGGLRGIMGAVNSPHNCYLLEN